MKKNVVSISLFPKELLIFVQESKNMKSNCKNILPPKLSALSLYNADSQTFVAYRGGANKLL
jgi:hypothetical protein